VGELRKDYFRERYVIVSPERAKRPHDLIRPTAPIAAKPTPFAPGNESMLPPITAQYPYASTDATWQFRVVQNRFPIVKPEGGQREPTTTNSIFTWADAYGEHEIVIEGRDDFVPFAQLGQAGIAEALRVGIERVRTLASRDGIRAVAYFKNEGLDAGASIAHPHSQLIATAILPPTLMHLATLHTELRKEFGFSPLYKILDEERHGLRMVRESAHFAVLCPYASRFPMEALIIPLRDSSTYLDLTDMERADLATQLHALVEKLSSIGAPYNIEWIHAPGTALHWHISITPRLAIWAGYEIETNIIVNPIPPEHAAAFYRAQ
jgi:UDPglucose--hexose-1-phosphate uridylyltransferase